MLKKMIFAIAAVAMVLVGCQPPETTTYSIKPNPASVEVGKTVQLTLSPEATATWTSKDAAIATVDDKGLVTGVKAGQTTVTATIGSVATSAVINVTEAGANPQEQDEPEPDPSTLHKSLQGSEYYVFQLDETTIKKMRSRVKADLRANDGGDGSNTHSFFIWEDTYSSGTTSGRNFYGEAEGWYSFQVLSKGWSGGGLNIHDAADQQGGVADMNPLSAIMANPADYVFHIAMKSTDNATHMIQLGGSAGSKGSVAIGAADYNDNGTIIKAVADFTRDGSWGEIEIPMTTFTNQGLQYASNNMGDGINALVFLSGGQAGTMLQFDACFIYKK